MADDDDESRARAIALLEATHNFPTDYAISVIAFNVDVVVAAIVTALEDAGLVEPLDDAAYETVMSSGGRYASHRFKVPCEGPEDVLALYARLRSIKGVVTVM